MGRVTVVDGFPDFRARIQDQTHRPLIDWLQEHMPGGFGGPAIVLRNAKRWQARDFDQPVGSNDEVLIIIMPAAAATAWLAGYVGQTVATALVSAAIGTALSFAINWLFAKPITPLAAGPGAPSPVYSLSAPTNQARLGEPVPVVYGSVLAVPDVASQPYTWYADNEQYLGMLLCVGNGTHTVSDLQIADSPVSQMPSGLVEYWVFEPWQHLQTAGTIAGISGIMEDVDSSPEVADQELLPVEAQRANAASLDVPTRTLSMPIAIESTVIAGDTVTLREFAPNSGTYTIESIATDYKSCVLVETLSSDNYLFSVVSSVRLHRNESSRVRIEWGDAFVATGDWVGADVTVTTTGEFAATFTGRVVALSDTSIQINDQGLTTSIGDDWLYCDLADITITPTGVGIVTFERQDVSAGPFAANRPGSLTQNVMCDVVFPEGLYGIGDKGQVLAIAVDVRFDYVEIDDAGDPVGPSYSQTVAFGGMTTTPQRRTIYQAVASGRYQVSTRRITGIDPDQQGRSTCIWTGLKARINGATQDVWGETTMMAVKIKATNGIAQGAQNRVGVRVQRTLNGSVLDNPADVFTDILTNDVYGGGRPTSEVDTDTVEDMRDLWKGDTEFNAVFDSKNTVWGASQQSLQVVPAYPVVVSGEVSIVADQASSDSVASFDVSSIVEGTFAIAYRFDTPGDNDGYEVEYRDDNFMAQTHLYPATSIDPAKVNLFGCTDSQKAQDYAQLMWQQKLYRRKQVSFDVELSGLIPQVGDRIKVSHRILGDGSTSERFIVESVRPGENNRVSLSAMYDDDRVYALG